MKILPKEKYNFVMGVLKAATINTLFAQFVAEYKVSGKIYVNEIENPTSFYIIHPYGMTLLIGDTENEKFNKAFLDYALNSQCKRTQVEWMQAYPNSWDKKLKALFDSKLIDYRNNLEKGEKNIVEQNTRVNFKFNEEKYLDFKVKNIKDTYDIVRTDEAIFHAMEGTVVPANFWDNATDFCTNGIGFSLFNQGQLAATAYSAYIFENELELGMETFPECRGKGFGQHVCSALIDYCLANNYEPIWACRLENKPSYYLARKLGFEPILELPYYKLNI